MRTASFLSTLCLAILLSATQLRAGNTYLGIRLSDVNADRANALRLGEPRGVEVQAVEDGSPAEQAGIKAGDILLSYNGENILGAQQLGRLVAETPAGRRIKLQYWREGKTGSLIVTTGSRTVYPGGLGSGGLDLDPANMPSILTDFPYPLLAWRNRLLGVESQALDSQLAHYFGVKHGILIRYVREGSAADKAGLKAGDVLTAIGDRAVTTPHDVGSYLATEGSSAKAVSVHVMRDNKAITINVPLPEDQQ